MAIFQEYISSHTKACFPFTFTPENKQNSVNLFYDEYIHNFKKSKLFGWTCYKRVSHPDCRTSSFSSKPWVW